MKTTCILEIGNPKTPNLCKIINNYCKQLGSVSIHFNTINSRSVEQKPVFTIINPYSMIFLVETGLRVSINSID